MREPINVSGLWYYPPTPVGRVMTYARRDPDPELANISPPSRAAHPPHEKARLMAVLQSVRPFGEFQVYEGPGQLHPLRRSQH